MTNLLSLQATRSLVCLGGALLCAHLLVAQTPENPTITEASEPIEATAPLDDFTARSIVRDHAVLKHQPIREADIMWEKRIWRVIDVREKMNLPFTYPDAPLFGILSDAAQSGDLTVYSTEDDRFSKPLNANALHQLLFRRDTIALIDDYEMGTEVMKVVENAISWEDVKRFRIKEAWFFDKNTGTMNTRILGIAPMINKYDDEGNFKYEMPLFWVHYESVRPILAKQRVFLPQGNLAATMSWEDLFEMRYFGSTIYKENNIYDRRIGDYLVGTDALFEADKIKNEIFNFEQDMWQQ